MSDSLNNKELVAVGHQFAKALSSDTAIMDMAKMFTRLAERLDCTTAALREMTKQRDALAAENAALKESEREFDKMCAEEFGHDWVSEFTETPSTDAFLAEVRASTVEEFVRMADYYESVVDGEIVVTPNSVFVAGHEFAAQLRHGGAA
ncbi:hypothetical protein [Leclercia sp.]|uniref:hypothetical protein n=1 Tax=Leclercia sp. TaxID=1898428 RepID=UPI0028B0ACFB|nr:hypothetical protein [Leclercia sp.]